jgi:hypothetical protein
VRASGAIKEEVDNEEKMFISYKLYYLYKLFDSIAMPLCFSCRDAGATGCKSGFGAGNCRVTKGG